MTLHGNELSCAKKDVMNDTWASDHTYLWPDVEARELEEFRKGNLMIEEVNDETASAAAAADSEQQVTLQLSNL